MDARAGDQQAGPRAGLTRGVAVAGAVLAVVVTAVLVRVEAGPPERLVVEQETPEPTPSARAEPDWAPVGSWRRMAVAPVRRRSGAVARWTGKCLQHAPPRTCGELLVWGGWSGGRALADGAAYDPAADAWRTLPPAPRSGLVELRLPGAWTGTRSDATLFGDPERPGELVVWGATGADLGAPGADPDEPRGVALDPVTGRWRILPEAPLAPRVGHSMTWTGEHVVVWGGRRRLADGTFETLGDGATYDPVRDAWQPLPPAPLRARSDHVAMYLPGPHAVFVWGGSGGGPGQDGAALLDGAVYDPARSRWRGVRAPPLAPAGTGASWRAAAARETRTEDGVLVVAPLVDAAGRPALAQYNAGSGGWQVRLTGPIGLRSGAQAAGYGNLVIVWGGSHPDGEPLPSGAVYYVHTGGWRLLAERYGAHPGDTAAWTGAELLVWGGGAEGGVFDPSARPRPGPWSQAAGEAREVSLPGGATTNWPLVPTGEAMSVAVRGADAADVEVWLSTGHGSATRRRESILIDCPQADRCVHRFAPVAALVPGGLRLHVANAALEHAALRITVERG